MNEWIKAEADPIDTPDRLGAIVEQGARNMVLERLMDILLLNLCLTLLFLELM